MKPSMKTTSLREARRLRTSLAAVVGFSALGCTPKSDEPTTQVVVVSPVPSGETTPSTTVVVAEPVPHPVPEPVAHPAPPGATTGPGWKSGDLYCVHEADTAPNGPGCGPKTTKLFSIPDQPNGMHGFEQDVAGTQNERKTTPDACCYHVIRPARGRPLRDATGEPVTAPRNATSAWSRSIALDLDAGDRAARFAGAAAWAQDAALEHASVAEFSRLALALLALGAPPALVAASQEAALDEIRHAETAFAIAGALGGEAVGPGRLVMGALDCTPSLVELVGDTLRDGCVGECLAALELRVAAATCADPVLSQALGEMAADEERHAALAYAVVLWALEVASGAEREAIALALDETVAALSRQLAEAALDDAVADDVRASLFGRLSRAEAAHVRRDGLRAAVLPALGALAARARQKVG